jgi:hypothetical protein
VVSEAILTVPVTILKEKKKWKKNKETNYRIRRIRKGRLLSPFLDCSEKYYPTNYNILLMPWYLKGMMYSVTMFGLQNRTELVIVRIQLQSFIMKYSNLWIMFHRHEAKIFPFSFLDLNNMKTTKTKVASFKRKHQIYCKHLSLIIKQVLHFN